MSYPVDADRSISLTSEARVQTGGGGQECVLHVNGISKKFCRSLKLSLWYGLKDVLRELNPIAAHDEELHGRPEISLRSGEFWASRDISFALRRGECLGLIGHNGAGKTTLLRMLNGLIKPDQGSIEIKGRVGALIALGAGFNPVLSGRENIYVNGAVLGLSKSEVDEKIDEIIEFSELQEFIDSPVQSYSSGMSVRLGFAIASTLEPDVLLLDEVLAVGDMAFAIKCLNRVRSLVAKAAVILVSHNMNSIASFCTRILLLDRGQVVMDTCDIGKAIDRYNRMIKQSSSVSGSGGIELQEIQFDVPGSVVDDGVQVVDQGSTGELRLKFEVEGAVKNCRLMPYFGDETYFAIMGFPLLDSSGNELLFGPGVHEITIPVGAIELNPGNYNFILATWETETNRVLRRYQGLSPFRVRSNGFGFGKLSRPVRVS